MSRKANLSPEVIFSTFEIAQLLSVDIGSVILWIDQARLKAYRTPGGHRRVRHDDLLTFLKTYNIPIPEGLARTQKIVLIVEDEALIRLHLKRMIQDLLIPQLIIEEAQDGYQAGKKIEQLKPDLVVLDVRLPGVDGFQICRDLRGQEGSEQTRVLVVSGQLTSEERKRIIETGANEVMSKPVNPEVFKEKVRHLLSAPILTA